MKKTILMAFIATFALFGCAYTSETEKAAQVAKESVYDIDKTLSPECKTDLIQTKLKSLEKEIDSIERTCEIEKDQIQSEKATWIALFFGLVAAVLAGILGKIGSRI